MLKAWGGVGEEEEEDKRILALAAQRRATTKYARKAGAIGQPPALICSKLVDTTCRLRPLLPRCASQVISREIINLGFANNGVMELSVAALLGDITEAAAIIIDCLPNMTPAQVTNRTVPLVRSPPVVPPWPRWPPVAGTRRGWQQLRQPWPRPRPCSPRLWPSVGTGAGQRLVWNLVLRARTPFATLAPVVSRLNTHGP